MNGASPPVTFDYETWVTMFPTFANLTPQQGQAYFNLATMICANDVCNPANTCGLLTNLLYLLTCHMAFLNCPKDANGNPAATGDPASTLVGRISNASEGSVSVQTDYPLDGNSTAIEKFLSQTQWGVQYWAMTSQFRTARYAALPTRVVLGGLFPGLFSPGGFTRR